MNQDVHNLLKELGADTIMHSDGTLYEHLSRVEEILKISRCSQEVSTAGLIHSIYGTEFFKTVTTTDRSRVRTVAGERAEYLAWIFCNANRPFCWFTGNNIPLRDGNYIRIDNKTLHDLRMIESANLIDQQQSPEIIVSFSSNNNILD
jgi:hypothetical protein